MKEFEPSLSRGGDMSMELLAGEPIEELQQIGKRADDEAKEKTKGFEVAYERFAINGKVLGLASRYASSKASGCYFRY